MHIQHILIPGHVDPTIELDEYVAEHSGEDRTIIFMSDIDTLIVVLPVNAHYDFYVELSDKRQALTRINTSTDMPATFESTYPKYRYVNNIAPKTDTIPFRLFGKSDQIYLTGTVNNSDTLNMLFDTGANAVVLESSLVGNKVEVDFDGQTENNGADGTHTVETSTNNTLKIHDLIWDEVQLLSIGFNDSDCDVVLGWNIFHGKIVELNYDEMALIIHQDMSTVSKTYTPVESAYIDGIPHIKTQFRSENANASEWFTFDTGSSSSVIVSHQFDNAYELSSGLESHSESTHVGSQGGGWKTINYNFPIVKLGTYEFYEAPINVSTTDPEGMINNIIGIDILRRLNTVLNFQDNTIYLKPNTLMYSSFEAHERMRKSN